MAATAGVGRAGIVALVAAMLSACQSTSVSQDLPHGDAAYTTFPSKTDAAPADYRIGPLDVLSVNVFKEPDLSLKDLQVDASGNMIYPLIGSVRAAGKTTTELSGEIAKRLNENYLRNAQVSVIVTASVSQRITVEGDVQAPGVYDITGSSTLLQAIAQAKSPTKTASLSQVVVFRFSEGKRSGAVFNLKAIREGKAPDPQLQGGDIVVVGYSGLKGAFRDFISSAPLLGLFRYF